MDDLAITHWNAASKRYAAAREAADTPEDIEFANQLAIMPPNQAADEIENMFRLCADEDLAADISCDLQLAKRFAEPIAAAIVRKRRDRTRSV